MRFRFPRFMTGPAAIVAASGALAVAGLGAAGAAGAFAPAASSSATSLPAGSLHGCVAGASRTMEHVYTSPSKGLTCPAGSFLVTWNEKGATGAQGPAGPAGPQGPAGPAGSSGSAGASADETQSSVIQVTGHDDSGANSAKPWAEDGYAMDMTVIRHDQADVSHCQAGATACWFYTGSIMDNGTFTSNTGAQSPGSQDVAISGIVTGSFTGGSSFQFYADSGNLQPSSLTSVTGGPSTSDTSWPASFLPGPATVTGYSLQNWGWTYSAPATCETWVDAEAGSTGDITGVNACKS